MNVLTTFDIKEASSKVKSNKKYRLSIYTYDIIDLTIVDDIRPKQDWEILGIVDFKDSIIKPAPNKQIPTDLVKDMDLVGKSDCDHCNKRLMRNKTVFVRNVEDGEIKQVGGTCTSYYLGLNYERVLNYMESMESFNGFDDPCDEFGRYPSGSLEEDFYDVEEILSVYNAIVKKDGVSISKRVAEERKIKPTSSKVDYYITNRISSHRNMSSQEMEEENKRYLRVEKEKEELIKSSTKEEIENIKKFIEDKKEESNFMLNVYNKLKEGFVSGRLINYVTGGCSFYFSVNKVRKEDNSNKNVSISNHVGVIGEKTSFENVIITDIKSIMTQFGPSNIYTMKDERGNVLTKFGKIADKFIVEGEEVVVGTKLSFTSDVKRHDSYKEVKQTLLGRLSKYNTKFK